MKLIRLALIALLFTPSLAFAATLAGVPRVVDGDTLVINGERIRLHGMNAVESKQTCRLDGRAWDCGQAATRAMQQAVTGGQVQCSGNERDPYGRLVAKCWNARGEDLSERMVAEGWATAYRRYSQDYVQVEAEAKAAGVGVWAGEFEDPETYRHGTTSAAPVGRSTSTSTGLGAIAGSFSGFMGKLMPTSARSRPVVSMPTVTVSAPAQEAYVSPLSLPSDQFPQGDRVQGVGGLSGRQYCALASLAGRNCR